MSRELDTIEKFNVCRNCNDVYSNFAVTGHYNVPITKELLSQGLKTLIEEFPVFQNAVKRFGGDDIKDGYGNYRMVKLEEILFDTVATISNKPFDESQLEEINKIKCKSDANKPTWRVILFTNNYLTFLCDHSLFDGESGRNFHIEMCRIFNTLSNVKFVNKLYSFNDSEIALPSTKKYNIYQYSYWDVVKFLFWDNLPNRLKEFYNQTFIEYYPNIYQYPRFVSFHKKTEKTNFKTIKIDGQQMTELTSVLKFNNVSMTAFLNVYLNYCLQNTVLAKHSSQLLSTVSAIPMSGRRYYPHSDDLKFRYMVTAANLYSEPITKMETNWFPIMKSINSQLQKEIKSQERFRAFGLLELVNVYDFMKPKDQAKVELLFEISNLGFSKIQSEKWQVDDLLFSQTTGVSSPFVFSVSSTVNGANIVLGYLDEYKDYPIDQFIEFFNDHLDVFISSNAVPH